jgi:hypothetical protein
VPVVWSDGPMDPGGFRGRPPFGGWGSMWQHSAERIPLGFEQVVERVPRFQRYAGGERFRGWVWRCPGLCSAGAGEAELCLSQASLRDRGPDPHPNPLSGREREQGGKADKVPLTPALSRGERGEGGKSSGCGRLVRALYAPLPVWTVGKYRGLEEGLEVEGLSGEWLPGVMDRWAGRRSLACERCWRVKRQTFADSTGWNELVSYLSGGLLYGREVARPGDWVFERKRAYRQRRGSRGAGGEAGGGVGVGVPGEAAGVWRG